MIPHNLSSMPPGVWRAPPLTSTSPARCRENSQISWRKWGNLATEWRTMATFRGKWWSSIQAWDQIFGWPCFQPKPFVLNKHPGLPERIAVSPSRSVPMFGHAGIPSEHVPRLRLRIYEYMWICMPTHRDTETYDDIWWHMSYVIISVFITLRRSPSALGGNRKRPGSRARKAVEGPQQSRATPGCGLGVDMVKWQFHGVLDHLDHLFWWNHG